MQNAPAEVLNISPEALEVANCHLELQNINEVAKHLSVPVDRVSEILNRSDVRAYINKVFFDIGYNNKFKVRKTMDSLINKKLEELEEADISSSKDISELLALSHKMSMDILDREIQLEKLQQNNIKNQTNIQINNDSKYTELIEKLIGGDIA